METTGTNKDNLTFIFDFDGTIADTFYFVLATVNKDPARFGIDGIDPTEVPRLRGLSIRYLLKEFNVSIFKVPKFMKIVRDEMSHNLVDVNIITGMREVLVEMANQNIKMGILTSNSVDNVVRFLKINDLELFDFVYSEKNLFGKHRSLKKIIKKYSLDKENTLYIGDEVRDVEAAEKADIKSIAVTWGFNSSEILKKYEPTYLANSPESILEIAETLLKGIDVANERGSISE